MSRGFSVTNVFLLLHLSRKTKQTSVFLENCLWVTKQFCQPGLTTTSSACWQSFAIHCCSVSESPIPRNYDAGLTHPRTVLQSRNHSINHAMVVGYEKQCRVVVVVESFVSRIPGRQTSDPLLRYRRRLILVDRYRCRPADNGGFRRTHARRPARRSKDLQTKTTAVRRQATTTLAWSITSGAGVHCQPAVLHTPRPSSEFDSVTPWDLVRRIDCDWTGESVQKGESGNSCILFIKFITLYVAVAKLGNSAVLFIRLSHSCVLSSRLNLQRLFINR